MRIVDRKEFLALPSGTIYAKFGAQPKDGSYLNLTHGEVAIKGDTSAGVDWWVQDLFPWFAESSGSDDYHETLERMLLHGAEAKPDYDCESRDGYFDEDQLFVIWDREDAERLIARLQRALADGYQCKPS